MVTPDESILEPSNVQSKVVDEESNHSPHLEDIVTVLSIDGGGVRGIIPAKVLEFLESELKVS